MRNFFRMQQELGSSVLTIVMMSLQAAQNLIRSTGRPSKPSSLYLSYSRANAAKTVNARVDYMTIACATSSACSKKRNAPGVADEDCLCRGTALLGRGFAVRALSPTNLSPGHSVNARVDYMTIACATSSACSKKRNAPYAKRSGPAVLVLGNFAKGTRCSR
jgi:hypothetical protein